MLAKIPQPVSFLIIFSCAPYFIILHNPFLVRSCLTKLQSEFYTEVWAYSQAHNTYYRLTPRFSQMTSSFHHSHSETLVTIETETTMSICNGICSYLPSLYYLLSMNHCHVLGDTKGKNESETKVWPQKKKVKVESSSGWRRKRATKSERIRKMCKKNSKEMYLT